MSRCQGGVVMWKESGGRTGGAVSSKGRLSAMRRNMTEIGRRTEEAILHQGITYLATAPWQTYYTKLLRDEGLRDEGAGSGCWCHHACSERVTPT